MNTSVQPPKRIQSIDIMRGLTLFLMLFVNDLFVPGVPQWLVHTKADVDGMGLADWVFPGFLFMVGMSIPYAIESRSKKGQSRNKIFGHILIRTLSLLIIGILMMNIGRLNPELSGISKNAWALILLASVFLVWNNYPESEKYGKLFLGLKILGAFGLLTLVILFRSGDAGNVSWLVTGWWGILGLIGWGYFVAATANLLLGSKLWPTVFLWLFFVVLNILSQLGILHMLDFLNPILGIILKGNIPSIVLAGLVISLMLRQSILTPWKLSSVLLLLGLLAIAAGFLLRNWFIISKIFGTPSWAMICNGISIILFAFLYLVIDVYKKDKWAAVFRPAGQNSLTTYLAPDIIYFICWGLSIHLFFYKQSSNQALAVCGSLAWAFAMIGFTALLAKIHIRLKL